MKFNFCSVQEIVDGLFIGDLDASNSSKYIKQVNPGLVVRFRTPIDKEDTESCICTTQSYIHRPKDARKMYSSRRINELVIDARDDPNFQLSKYFARIVHSIDLCLKKGRNVLVHCDAGISRSATAIVAYLIHKSIILDKDPDWKSESIKSNVHLLESLVASKRPIISVSVFEEQLYEYVQAVLLKKYKPYRFMIHD